MELAEETWKVDYGKPKITSTNCKDQKKGHSYRKVLGVEALAIKTVTKLDGAMWMCTKCGKIKTSM